LPVAEEMWRREVAMTKCDTRLCVSARNQSLKFTIGVGTPLLTALLIRLRFHLARAQKVPISPRISSFPPSFPKRVSFVPSNESCWKYCSDDPLFSLSLFLSLSLSLSLPFYPCRWHIYIFPTRSSRSNMVCDRYGTSNLFDSLLLLRKRITTPSNYFAFRIATMAVAMTTTRLRLRLRLGRCTQFCKSY